ncbi:hypothetical protein [Marinagarivorans algicola]|uniref:hypothetical protein n=1 Tax=Marinagarivorans algicola TaxID=1513270 RepID=UPI0037368738
MIIIDDKVLRKVFDNANQQSAISMMSTFSANAEEKSRIMRSHRAIGNTLHRVLSVVFYEYDSHIRTKNTAG